MRRTGNVHVSAIHIELEVETERILLGFIIKYPFPNGGGSI